MTEDQSAIWNYLTLYKRTKNQVRISSLMTALRDARGACCRYPKTGLKRAQAKTHASWIGTIGYMILLDQIGKCLKPRHHQTTIKKKKQGHPFEKALKYFSKGLTTPDLTDKGIEALHILRCAFAHDFSLYQKKFPAYRFTVCEREEGPLIKIGKPWHGDCTIETPEEQRTWINLEKFQDLVEAVYDRLVQQAKQGELEIALSGKADELNKCHTLTMMVT